MDITIGLEEELMIVDPGTRAVITDPDPDIFEQAREHAAPHRVVNEFMRSQIETNSAETERTGRDRRSLPGQPRASNSR